MQEYASSIRTRIRIWNSKFHSSVLGILQGNKDTCRVSHYRQDLHLHPLSGRLSQPAPVTVKQVRCPYEKRIIRRGSNVTGTRVSTV